MITVYTGGTFDLFHAGHARFLQHARSLGDRLIVALNGDGFVERFKGRHPVCSYAERAAVLLSCRYVDDVVPNIGDENSGPTIEFIRPSVIAIGDDWDGRDYLGQLGIDWAFLDRVGARILYLPYTEGISTTEIVRRIESR